MKANGGTAALPARQRAIVAHPVVSEERRDRSDRLKEACALAQALDLDVAMAVTAPVRRINPATFFGAGRVAEFAALFAAGEADLLIVDAALGPVQQRNLEQRLNAKVIDRTGLILEIFARRARSSEGRLQVELARMAYEKSRLVRTWTHLERQRGGLGKTGGPGETQLEIDHRLIEKRIDKLKHDLDEVRRMRGLQRRARARAGLPTIVLVGYTNAGKSSLFNRMTAAGVFAKDMPFATLDPTARAVRLPSGRSVIVADTVGFISDLPTELIAAFRATLEAVSEADLLIHVRDIAHPHSEDQREDVLGVLKELPTAPEKDGARPPILEAWNKVDLLSADRREGRAARASGEGGADGAIAVSARTGEGVDALLEAMDRLAFGPTQALDVTLDPADGRTRAWLLAHGRLLEEALDEDGSMRLKVDLPAAMAARVRAQQDAPLAAE